MYLVDENPKSLTVQFIKELTEKQEAIVVDVLKQHPYHSDFQMLLMFCRFKLVSSRSYIVTLLPTLNKFHKQTQAIRGSGWGSSNGNNRLIRYLKLALIVVNMTLI